MSFDLGACGELLPSGAVAMDTEAYTGLSTDQRNGQGVGEWIAQPASQTLGTKVPS